MDRGTGESRHRATRRCWEFRGQSHCHRSWVLVQEKADQVTAPVDELGKKLVREGVIALVSLLSVIVALWLFVLRILRLPDVLTFQERKELWRHRGGFGGNCYGRVVAPCYHCPPQGEPVSFYGSEDHNLDMVEQQILEHLKRICGGNPTIQDSLALIGVDSVGMAELTFDIEKQFSIQVDDSVLDVETVPSWLNMFALDKPAHHETKGCLPSERIPFLFF